MSVLSLLHTLRDYIIQNGTFDDELFAKDPKEKAWHLNGVTAFSSNDGETIGLETPTLKVTQMHNYPPMIWRGSELEMIQLSRRI